LSPDEKSIAISTLDQSIVTYPLSDEGPVIEGMKEFTAVQLEEAAPIVPVGLTSEGHILGGSTTGDVSVISAESCELSSLSHSES
jgi:hypothetical protein